MIKWVDMVSDLIIILGIIINLAYTRQLEKRLNALKSWIEFFWRIDFEAMADFVKKGGNDEAD